VDVCPESLVGWSRALLLKRSVETDAGVEFSSRNSAVLVEINSLEFVLVGFVAGLG